MRTLSQILATGSLGILIMAVSAGAQAKIGTIRGIITDASRAPLPGVTVTLTNTTDSKADYVALTKDTGQYQLDVPPAIYDLKAELRGFSTATMSRVEIKEGNATQVDLRMSIGRQNADGPRWQLLQQAGVE